MDKRILDKAKQIAKEQAEKAEADRQARIKAEAEAEQRHKEYISSEMPKARQFVETYVLDEIAKCVVRGEKKLPLHDVYHTLGKKGLYLPAEEAVLVVLKEIEGLEIKSEYIPEYTGYINSDEVMETRRAYYEYTVVWK